MRVSAFLLFGCLFAAVVPLYAQLDAHLRLSGGIRPSQYQGSAASMYVGLGTAAESALGDAEQVAEALMNVDGTDAATAAARKSIAVLQGTAGRKHRKVKHGRHGHKRTKNAESTIVYDGGSSGSYGSNAKDYEPKDYEGPKDEEYQLDIPSENDYQHRWNDDYKAPRAPKGPPMQPDSSRGYGESEGPSGGPDREYEGNGGGRRRFKRRQGGGGGGGYNYGEEDSTYEGPPGKGDGYQDDPRAPRDGPPKKRRGGGGEYGDDEYSDTYPGSGYAPLSSPKNVCKQVLLEEEEVEVVFTPTKDKATVTTLLGTCANPVHPLPTLGGGCVVECQHVEDLCNITPLNSHAFLAPANFKSMDNYYPVMCSYRADAPLKGSCNIVMKVACCSDVAKAELDDAGDKATNKAKVTVVHKSAADKSAADKATDTKSPKQAGGSTTDKATDKAAADNKGADHKTEKTTDKTKATAGPADEDFDEEDDGEYYAVVKSKLLRIPLPTLKY